MNSSALSAEAAAFAAIPIPTLRTARLILREPRDSDAPAWEKLCQPLEVAKNTLRMPHPYPPGAALEWVARLRQSHARGESFVFAVLVRDEPDGEGTLIGSAGLHVDPPHRHAEIGYVLGIDRWGKGYATEAARAIVEFGFGTLRLHRLHAGYYTRNPASGRVLEKLGFREEGRRPQMYMRFGEWVDLVLVGMLRQEWERGGDTMRL